MSRLATKERLITDLDAAYQRFVEEIADLDERSFERKWLDGRWGVREIAAHHTGWLGQLAGGLERMSRGERPAEEGAGWTDTDAWNERFAERAKGKRKEQVIEELRAALESFKEAARKLPDERFEEGKTAEKMFEAAGISHFDESAQMVREWRAEGE